MGLYFVLFGITALGVIALALIIWGGKPKTLLPIDHDTEHDPVDVNLLIQEDEEPVISLAPKQIERIEPQFSDQALASLGFSAFDGLIDEPKVNLNDAYSAYDQPAKKNSSTQKEEKYYILYVMAPKAYPFVGYDLLQALSVVGLQYGNMKIFHCYDDNQGDNKNILFSVTSAVEPGIFDLTNIGNLSCPGLCLFMSTNVSADPAYVFDLMLETAEQLALDLEGTLCNEQREVMTEDLISDYRQELA